MERLNVINLTSILNKTIIDEDNEMIGTLKDIYFIEDGNSYPKAIGYRVNKNGDIYSYEFKSINFYEDKNENVSIEIRDEKPIITESYSFRIVRDVIGKELVDVDGNKNFKVHNAKLVLINDELRLVALDKSNQMLNFRKALKFLGKNKRNEASLILWDDVNINVKKNKNLSIDVPYKELSTIHPADLAEILEKVDLNYSAKVFETLEDEFAAETLEEMEEADVQAEIISKMTQNKAQEVLELMGNDEIAEILEDIDEDRKLEIMSNLEQDDAEEVNEIMSYEDEEVGSIMVRNFLSFPENIIKKEVMETVSELDEDFDFDEIYYIFVTDVSGKLLGYIPLSEFMKYDENTRLHDIMDTQIEDLEVDEHAETAVDLAIKYELLQIPVVDEEDVIIGVVNIHDIIDEFLAPLWKRKNKKD